MEEPMVARLTPAPVKLTQENHPENAVEPAEKHPTVSLPAMIGFGALSGVIGMAFGSAALSSILAFDEPGHLLSMLPLVLALVAFLNGWVGAFFWMCREETERNR
jgi:hypothetical protein